MVEVFIIWNGFTDQSSVAESAMTFDEAVERYCTQFDEYSGNQEVEEPHWLFMEGSRTSEPSDITLTDPDGEEYTLKAIKVRLNP